MAPTPKVTEIDGSLLRLPPRVKDCNKTDFGHVLIIGGDYGMPGSVCLAAEAALRVGAGMVTIATRPEHAFHALSRLPEAMIYGLKEVSDLVPLLERATHCVLGPGLGLGDFGISLFKEVLKKDLPMVVDASALRILANNPRACERWVLTPHPGEAAALLKIESSEIQRDRFQAVYALQTQFGGQIILKGVNTLLRTNTQETFVCTKGNPGMATAGMGDVLSGVIAGLAGQGLSLLQSAKLGVWLHAYAADLAAAQGGERGLIASDLMSFLHKLVNE